jgi:hypothetical protein
MPLKVFSTANWDEPTDPLPHERAELGVIAEYVKRGQCVVFVGAGMSASAGLPTWQRLMDQLVQAATPLATPAAEALTQVSLLNHGRRAASNPLVRRLRRSLGADWDRALERMEREHPDWSYATRAVDVIDAVVSQTRARKELDALVARARYPEVTSQCRQLLGAAAFHRLTRHLLTPTGVLPSTHQQLVRIPWAAVVTTNFDDLLERAWTSYGTGGVPRAPTGADLTQLGTLLLDRAFFILKAHGDLTRPSTLIFSAEDYQRSIHAAPAFQAVISGLLMTNAVLFLGYSLSDVNFRLLLDQQLTLFRGSVPPRYALMSGCGPEEQELLWRTARLQVLGYPTNKHENVERFLAALSTSIDSAAPTASAGTPPRAQPRTAVRVPRKDVAPDSTQAVRLSIRWGEQRLRFSLKTPRHSALDWVIAPSPGEVDRLSLACLAVIKAQHRRFDARPEVRAVGAQLAQWIPTSATELLLSCPFGTPLVVSCDVATMSVPWEWIALGEECVATRFALSRTSVLISDAARGQRRFSGRRAVLVGDGGSGDGPHQGSLPGAVHEALAAARLLRHVCQRRGVVVLNHEAATSVRLARELATGSVDCLHFGGHAWFDAHESCFFLWEGPMLGSELTPLLSREPPALFTATTHFTSFQPIGFRRPLDQRASSRPASIFDAEARQPPSGFAEVAMRCGVGAFVGCCTSPSDAVAAELTERFYERAIAGDTIAEALRAARHALWHDGKSDAVAFTVMGYGNLRLTDGSAGAVAPSRARASAPATARKQRVPDPTARPRR